MRPVSPIPVLPTCFQIWHFTVSHLLVLQAVARCSGTQFLLPPSPNWILPVTASICCSPAAMDHSKQEISGDYWTPLPEWLWHFCHHSQYFFHWSCYRLDLPICSLSSRLSSCHRAFNWQFPLTQPGYSDGSLQAGRRTSLLMALLVDFDHDTAKLPHSCREDWMELGLGNA